MEQSQSLQSSKADDGLIMPDASNYRSAASPGSPSHGSPSPYNHDRDPEDTPAPARVKSGQKHTRILRTLMSSLSLVLTYVALIFPRSLRPASGKKGRELSETAYLDALRGYASWIVYNSHVIHENWRPESSAIMQWSCFKILFRGHAQVDIFFVISGYALSYRMLGYVYSGQSQRVSDSLASSTFRRYLRLFMPTAVASFITMIALSLRLATKGEPPEVLKESFAENLRFWIVDTIQASNPFTHVGGWWHGSAVGTKYLPQMWTIAVEFRGSMVLFLFCAATCKMGPRSRMSTTWIWIIASFWWQAQYVGLFLAGLWIADLRMRNESERQDRSLPSISSGFVATTSPATLPSSPGRAMSERRSLTSTIPSIPKSSSTPSFVKQIPYIALAIFSLKPLTAPLLINKGHSFPNGLLARLMPPNIDPGAHVHWPLGFGAFLLVYSIDHSPILQKPLRLPVSQFVGELSFGLYAMHNTVRWIAWEKTFVKWQLAYWGSDALGFWHLLPGYLVMTVLVIWAAEWFRRIDMKVVAWGKTLQEYCFESR